MKQVIENISVLPRGKKERLKQKQKIQVLMKKKFIKCIMNIVNLLIRLYHTVYLRLTVVKKKACSECLFKHQSKELLHRSEEHTSELQSRGHLVCRLLLEK